MKLTDVEKLILHNQYDILAIINPSSARDYELLRTCLTDGYEQDFDQLMPHFDTQEPGVGRQVRQILEMFRSLTPPGGSGISAPAVFAGFDGNEETEHY